ncbi:MAG: LysR family transcriptional regulator [Candidatus Thorarchaeota archaeon]
MTNENNVIDRLEANWKLWLEADGKYVFGPGAFAILKSIRDTGTITEGAKTLGMSYRYAWGVIKKIEKQLGIKLLETYKGGTVGGGGATVTEAGLRLIVMYDKICIAFEQISKKHS